MTIEQKAKAYDEAIERAKEICAAFPLSENTRNTCETIFPELKENEDERIRKECISIIDAWDKSCRLEGDYCDAASCIAWLEKQGEKKPTDEEMKELLRTEYEKGRADAIAETQVAWSEEDSVRLQRIIDFLWHNRKGDTDEIYQQEQDIDWLKSLKPHTQWKPSEKQMEALDYYANSLCTYCDRQDDLRSLYNDLKKLKEE